MNPSIEGASKEHLLQNFLKVTIAQYRGMVTSIIRGARGVLPLSSTGPQRESPFEVYFFGGWVIRAALPQFFKKVRYLILASTPRARTTLA
jgi:hypothetical protein